MTATTDTAAGSHWVVEIAGWNWNLHIRLSPEQTPVEHRFQGALTYTRGIHLEGQVIASAGHAGNDIRVWILPVAPAVRFGPDDMDEVGRLYVARRRPDELEATLLLPEESLDSTLRGLACDLRFLCFSIFDVDSKEASISSFEFSSMLPIEGRAQ